MGIEILLGASYMGGVPARSLCRSGAEVSRAGRLRGPAPSIFDGLHLGAVENGWSCPRVPAPPPQQCCPRVPAPPPQQCCPRVPRSSCTVVQYYINMFHLGKHISVSAVPVPGAPVPPAPVPPAPVPPAPVPPAPVPPAPVPPAPVPPAPAPPAPVPPPAPVFFISPPKGPPPPPTGVGGAAATPTIGMSESSAPAASVGWPEEESSSGRMPALGPPPLGPPAPPGPPGP